MRADPEKLKAVQFSEAAQAAAEAVLSETVFAPEKFFDYMRPFYEADDILSAFLVSTAFFKKGGNLAAMCQFAVKNRQHETYGPILNWFKTSLVTHGSEKSTLANEEINLYSDAATLWVESRI